MKTLIINNRIFSLVLTVIVLMLVSQNLSAQLKADWISRYNKSDKNDKASAMATDSRGFIYVTGSSEDKEGGTDIMTVKYSSEGNEIWAATFEGPSNADGDEDISNAIVSDNAGYTYITGSVHGGHHGRDLVLIKYDPDGNEVFVRYFSGSSNIEDSDEEGTGIALDHEGHIIVAGNTNGINGTYDFCALKYTTQGSLVWINYYDNGSGTDDFVKAIKIDGEESIIFSGTSTGIISGKDYSIVKYNLEGDELWNAKYNGVGGNITINDDELNAMTLDDMNNIYVTGYSTGAGSGKDFLTIKYDAAGKEQWISRNDNMPLTKGYRNDDEASSIVTDANGIIYITGKTVSPETGSHFYTVKLDARGKTEWDKVFINGEFGGVSDDGALDLAADGSGNVYVTGFSTGFGYESSCGGNKDFATIKYSAHGELKWMKRYNGAGRFENSDDIAKAIKLDGRGGVIVMGESMGEETELDYCLIKYSEYVPYEETAEVKNDFRLNDNFPNPFNPVTKISFDIPVSSNVRLAIYDISGREVALLENKVLQAGNHKYDWNASQFSSGAYFCRIQAGSFDQTRKMLLIK